MPSSCWATSQGLRPSRSLTCEGSSSQKHDQSRVRCWNSVNYKMRNYGLFPIRLLELEQTGLISHWRKQFLPGGVSRCRSELKEKRKKLRSLNLRDLGSAFLVLGFGITITLAFFSMEVISAIVMKINLTLISTK